MIKLPIDIFPNGEIIKKLESIEIFSINDFLNTDVEKLVSCTELPFIKIFEIKQYLVSSCLDNPIDGLSLYKRVSSNEKLPTFINGFDTFMNGGMSTMVEICGLSGSGKTQMCMMIALNIATFMEDRVLYIDSKNDFSATRMHLILSKSGKDDEEIDDILGKIDVVLIKNVYELISKLLSVQQDQTEKNTKPSYRLIIIDSMTVLFLPYISGSEGLSYMNYVVSVLKSISANYKTTILLTNVATRFSEVEEEADPDVTRIESELKPLLGKYWSHIPHTRLCISRRSNSSDQRLLQVMKSCSLPLGKTCIVKITDKGVC